MFQRRTTFNPKRKIQRAPVTAGDRALLEKMAKNAAYGGNPERKKNPGDFDLIPPANWAANKELCDRVEIFTRTEALKLVRKGIRKGFISIQTRGDWPQNVWCMTKEGEPLEAELENFETGTYHGYPMSPNDPFRKQVIERWNKA